MAISPDFRLKVRHFFRDHYKPILIVLGVILVFAAINRILISQRYKKAPSTTYNPNVAVLDLSGVEKEVPEKVANEFEEFIKNYVGYCNNRNYVAAWNMVSEDCKKNNFENDYDNYVEYIQNKFNGSTKRYALQYYSSSNGKYIYNVKIFDDFLASGLTNQRFAYQEEKFAISYDSNKKLVCSVGNYMESKPINYMVSNDYLRIELTSVIQKYNFQVYEFNFINRTNYTIVIQDLLAEDWEVGLAVGNEIRPTVDDTKIVLEPGQAVNTTLAFEKFYDSTKEPNGIIFNAIRVMENYTGNPDTVEDEIANAVDKFNMTIAF